MIQQLNMSHHQPLPFPWSLHNYSSLDGILKIYRVTPSCFVIFSYNINLHWYRVIANIKKQRFGQDTLPVHHQKYDQSVGVATRNSIRDYFCLDFLLILTWRITGVHVEFRRNDRSSNEFISRVDSEKICYLLAILVIVPSCIFVHM